MTDETPVAAKPATKRRPRHAVTVVKELAPYIGLAVVWIGISFVPGISAEGKAEGHGLLLLFAGLIQATKKGPTDH